MDFGNRDKLLELIEYTPASIKKGSDYTKHPSGAYLQKMPKDPFTKLAVLDYKTAEKVGFFKFDFLNVHVYQNVKSEEHLIELMNREPMWDLLKDKEFVDMVIHINGHHDILSAMPEPVNSIDKMAMFLALIRPAKRHLVGKSWDEVALSVWSKSDDGSYGFKHSHAISYSHLVVVHMNLIVEGII